MDRKVIVITGSTKGIGFGLAKSFLDLNCKVVISGRNEEHLKLALENLQKEFPNDDISGQICDITKPDQLQNLWHHAINKFGKVNIWINNAGIAQQEMPAYHMELGKVEDIIHTNIMGTLNGCRIAANEMLKQKYGKIINMEGLGSDGRIVKGITIYGASKYAVSYITDAYAKELKNKNIVVAAIRPGMVLTDLLVSQYDRNSKEWERAKAIFNKLADTVETVTPYLAKKVLKTERSGRRITWLTNGRVLWRFITSLFYRRKIID